jgi:hypothetical protein
MPTKGCGWVSGGGTLSSFGAPHERVPWEIVVAIVVEIAVWEGLQLRWVSCEDWDGNGI